MILLFKGGDALEIANYRPITLIQIMYKIYANILTARLSDFVTQSETLSPAQAGFRKGRGPAQKLLAIDAAIRYAKRTKKELHMVSLDIKKAFDSVEHWLIREALGEHGLALPNNVVEAIMDTLRGNTINVRTENGLTGDIYVACGVRQGDPLSTTLFILVIDPLLQRLSEIPNLGETEGPQAFADDVDFLAHSPAAIEEAWRIILDFLNLTGLELSPTKTVYLRNRLAHGNQSSARLLLAGQELRDEPCDAPFKVLGVWFTMDGDWKRHKEVTRGACIGRLRRLHKKKITDIQYIEVVNTMILSALSYGMMVVEYTDAELKALNSTVQSFVRSRLRLKHDPAGWDDWLTLSKDKGGLGLCNIRDLHDATKVNSFMLTALGQESPAKRIIQLELARLNTGRDRIRIKEESVWLPVLGTLKRRGACLHSVIGAASAQAVQSAINRAPRTKALREWHQQSSMRNHPLADLLLRRENGLELNTRDEIFRLLTQRGYDPSAADGWNALEDIAEDVEIETLQNAISDARDFMAELLTKDKRTPATVTAPRGRNLYSVSYKGTLWEVAFTDGSQRDGVAGWGLFMPDKEEFPSPREVADHHERHASTTAFMRVEGKQTNIRAELLAILAALKKRIEKPDWETNFMIVTDSEYSIKTILNLHKLSKRQLLRTQHRDLLLQIVAHMKKIQSKAEVTLIHIYSHQESQNPENPGDKVRIEKIARQRREFGNDKVYDLLARGNQIADALANLATRGDIEHRDWARNPTEGTDALYITQRQSGPDARNQWIDGNVHKWIKQDTQTKILEKRTRQAEKGVGKRTQYLRHLGETDCARSFASSKKSEPRRHVDAITLFKARAHALPSLSKLHRQGSQGRNSNLRKCYREAYPDSFCPDHRAKRLADLGVPDEDADIYEPEGEIEDTLHLLTCEARQSRTDASLALWEEIRARIHAKQAPGSLDPACLKPFALRCERVTTSALPPLQGGGRSRHATDPYRSLRSVAAFPDSAAMLGLIPKGLVGALVELGIKREEAGQLADELSQLAQATLTRELRCRFRALAIERRWRLLLGKHVLGAHQSSSPDP